MSFRFFRRFKIAPGLTLNLTKRGGSLSVGPRGAKLTAGTSGVRRTFGVPGTGLWYTEKVGANSQSRSTRSRRGRKQAQTDSPHAAPTVPPEHRLDLGFFQRLFTPQDQEDFVDGMRHIVAGDEHRAYQYLIKAAHLADAAFIAGMLALKREQFDQADRLLRAARHKHAALGKYFEKYGVDAVVSLPITERISSHVTPSMRGVLLATAEAHQAQHRWREAIRELRKLYKKDPTDPAVLLSIVELLVEEAGDQKACREVVRLTSDVENTSNLHAAILLYKGKALRKLELHTAARDTLTAAFRRKKNREEDLLRAIQYERALIYEHLGRRRRSRQEMEKIYAQAPEYEDVARRLGLTAA